MSQTVATLNTKLRQALIFHQARRLAEAENIYRQILALRPDMAEIRLNCALAQMGQGKYDDAEQPHWRKLKMRSAAPSHSRPAMWTPGMAWAMRCSNCATQEAKAQWPPLSLELGVQVFMASPNWSFFEAGMFPALGKTIGLL
jgi:hypothetical protein